LIANARSGGGKKKKSVRARFLPWYREGGKKKKGDFRKAAPFIAGEKKKGGCLPANRVSLREGKKERLFWSY